MSKVAITGNASGTGTFTIAAPNSNTDRTLTLPDSAGTIATVESLPAGYSDSDALDLFNATGSAPVYACRAWVNFNGTGTVAIRASGNVSSISDIGTGLYRVNFTTAMPDTNYAIVAISGGAGGTLGDDSVASLGAVPSSTSQTPTLRFKNFSNYNYFDVEYGAIVVFR
jgi:hypothetical protein